MKLLMFIVTLLVAVSAIFAYTPPVVMPGPSPRFPTFPGHGPFNPKYKWPHIPVLA
ncbi:abaecin [Megalopta genalis]|uniref:abaecin n=1 Tax=Megalopta genalis TaxID=115081 RepID=UPI003FCF28CF